MKSKMQTTGGGPNNWDSGVKHWKVNGKLHRENGPAIIYPNGNREWWLLGKFYISQKLWKADRDFYRFCKNEN